MCCFLDLFYSLSLHLTKKRIRISNVLARGSITFSIPFHILTKQIGLSSFLFFFAFLLEKFFLFFSFLGNIKLIGINKNVKSIRDSKVFPSFFYCDFYFILFSIQLGKLNINCYSFSLQLN